MYDCTYVCVQVLGVGGEPYRACELPGYRCAWFLLRARTRTHQQVRCHSVVWCGVGCCVVFCCVLRSIMLCWIGTWCDMLCIVVCVSLYITVYWNVLCRVMSFLHIFSHLWYFQTSYHHISLQYLITISYHSPTELRKIGKGVVLGAISLVGHSADGFIGQ